MKSPSSRHFSLPEYCLPVGRRAVFITGMGRLVYTDFCHVAESRSAHQMQNVVFTLQLEYSSYASGSFQSSSDLRIGHCVFVSRLFFFFPADVKAPDAEKSPCEKQIP